MAKEPVTEDENIPTEKDWWVASPDLDSEYAYKRFFGKTIDQVMDYFHESVLCASEDISSMPAVPFRFYVRAYTKFLMEAPLESERDIDSEYTNGASSFLHLVLSKLEREPEIILPIMDKLMVTCEHVATNQERYDASIDIYGSFPEQLEQIKSKYAAMLK